MKAFIIFLAGSSLMVSCSVKKEIVSVKSLLEQQLKNTHNNEDWFVPLTRAVEGLTAEQSNWKDDSDNHSIAELVSHLVFWNERILMAFKRDSVPDFNDDNEITFQKFSPDQWTLAKSQLDHIQNEWEQVVIRASSDQIKNWSTSIANICAHNAYHTGQIIYIRKHKGWWR